MLNLLSSGPAEVERSDAAWAALVPPPTMVVWKICRWIRTSKHLAGELAMLRKSYFTALFRIRNDILHMVCLFGSTLLIGLSRIKPPNVNTRKCSLFRLLQLLMTMTAASLNPPISRCGLIRKSVLSARLTNPRASCGGCHLLSRLPVGPCPAAPSCNSLFRPFSV